MYNLTGDTIPRQYILQRQKKKEENHSNPRYPRNLRKNYSEFN